MQVRHKKKKPHHRSWFLVFSGLVVVVCLCLGLFFYFTANNNPIPANTDIPPNSPIQKEFPPKQNDPASDQHGIDSLSNDIIERGLSTTQPNLTVNIKAIDTLTPQKVAIETTVAPDAKGSCTVSFFKDDVFIYSETVSFSGNSCNIKAIDRQHLPAGFYNITVLVAVKNNRASSSQSVSLP